MEIMHFCNHIQNQVEKNEGLTFTIRTFQRITTITNELLPKFESHHAKHTVKEGHKLGSFMILQKNNAQKNETFFCIKLKQQSMQNKKYLII